MSTKLYPDSGVELRPIIAKYYDKVMNFGSGGRYTSFIERAIKDMNIKADDTILDLGCGTGRNAALMASYLGEKGKITGLDISRDMEQQYLQRFQNSSNVEFFNQRIDIAFDLNQQFDIVIISFVIHGFPHEIRSQVVQNALNHLKPGGSFFILDFAEFDMNVMPWFHRKVFQAIECKYAFDYIERDWKAILGENGFESFEEHHYFKNYVRLLKAQKK